MKKTITVLTLTGALLAPLACSGDQDGVENNQRNHRAPTVEAVSVIVGSLPLEERITGVVRAQNQTDIYPEVSAPVTGVLVNNGDFVDKGQILVQLRDTEAQERLRQAESGYQIARAQVRQAEAELNRRQQNLDRIRQLRSRDLETQSELDNAKALALSAEASLDLTRAQLNQARSVVEERLNHLEYTMVRAPVRGYVGLRNAEIGKLVNPSTRLFQIGDPEQIKIELILTETMTGYIRTGHTAVITAPGSGRNLESRITRISPFLNPVTHTTTAEIEVSNPDRTLMPGMFVTVNIKYGESDQAILVPNNAIVYHPSRGQYGVFTAGLTGRELRFEGDRPPEELIGPSPVRFHPVDVVARGRLVSGIEGISQDSWVVTLGQNLLLRGAENANVRPVKWDHIIHLQQLHSRDLFEIIQKKLAEQTSKSRSDV